MLLFKTFLFFYGSIFYEGSQSNSLQIFSAKNTQSDLKKKLFLRLRSNLLAEQEKRKMMNLFWNFIQNGLKGINVKTYNLNHNRIVRERTQQVVKWSLFFYPVIFIKSPGSDCNCGKCGSDSRRCGAEAIVQFYKQQTEDYLWFAERRKFCIVLI